MDKYIIGIDIGGTNVRIGAVDEEHNVKVMKKIYQKEVFDGSDAVEALIRLIEGFTKDNDMEQQVRAICLGFPATLNKERTRVMQTPNIAGMDNVEVVAPLTEKFKVPVFVDKDVSTALYFDKNRYQVPDCEVLIGCYFGTGIGNTISINGKLLTGHDGAACELGHIKVDGNESVCGCGNKGCMENVAGGKYLAHLCETVYQDTKVPDIFKTHGEDALIKQFVDRMAIAVTTEINILNPDYIMIGGGVPAMEGFPKEYMEACIHEHTRKPYPDENLRLIWVEDTIDKGVVGAALLAEEKMKVQSADGK